MKGSLSKSRRNKNLLTVLFAVIAILYVMPIVIVLINSFKSNTGINTQTFALPNAETFMGFDNYIKGVTFGNYNFWKCVEYSFTITILSTALIILCTSMAAWYISRVNAQAQHALDDTGDLSGLRRGACGVHVRGLCEVHADRDRGSRRHRRLRAAADLLPRRVPDAQADYDLCRRAGDYVGLERLPAALPRAQQGLQDHSHPPPF